jgi:hypothetical protein
MVDAPIAGPSTAPATSKPSRHAAIKARKAARTELQTTGVITNPTRLDESEIGPRPTGKKKKAKEKDGFKKPVNIELREPRAGTEPWPYVQLANSQLASPSILYSQDGRCGPRRRPILLHVDAHTAYASFPTLPP